MNESVAFIGQCWLLKIRRNVYCWTVGKLGQENELLVGLGMREFIFHCSKPFFFSTYYNHKVSLGK